MHCKSNRGCGLHTCYAFAMLLMPRWGTRASSHLYLSCRKNTSASSANNSTAFSDKLNNREKKFDWQNFGHHVLPFVYNVWKGNSKEKKLPLNGPVLLLVSIIVVSFVEIDLSITLLENYFWHELLWYGCLCNHRCLENTQNKFFRMSK